MIAYVFQEKRDSEKNWKSIDGSLSYDKISTVVFLRHRVLFTHAY